MRDGYEGVGTSGCCLSKIFRVRGRGGLTGLGGVPGLSLFLDACVKRTGKIKYLYCLLLKFNESCEKQIIKCTQ